jgi:hypothetical protein
MVMFANAEPKVAAPPLRDLSSGFAALAARCPTLGAAVAGEFRLVSKRHVIPRYTFLGPGDGFAQRRIGIFALLHGDEPAGALALLRWLESLAAQPSLARGYDLVCYPVCNPAGFEAGTRENAAGLDLNREFWRGSSQPEVRILENELRTQKFDGIIALHADDTSDGLYGYAHGRLYNENLLQPALRASEAVLPRNRGPLIDGFRACDGVISDCFCGVLAPPPDAQPQPFDLIFETPARVALELQAEATRLALLAILATHRGFISYAANL